MPIYLSGDLRICYGRLFVGQARKAVGLEFELLFLEVLLPLRLKFEQTALLDVGCYCCDLLYVPGLQMVLEVLEIQVVAVE